MKKEPCPNCGKTKDFRLKRDIGYDVSGEGEEREHIQRCDCGYWRMVLDVYPFDRDPFIIYCPWQSPAIISPEEL